MKKLFNSKLPQTENRLKRLCTSVILLSHGMYITIILQYKEHLSKLESEIDALAKEVEEYNIIKSISGI